jgi:GntR family transcriptional repressor for pyruvate dehydrogenase complex
MIVNSLGTGERLYQNLAVQLVAELIAGKYPIGSRLPAERELAQIYGVSRPTVREAVIAMEVHGFVEVRIGSGAYVMKIPGEEHQEAARGLTAFELTEARLVIEGEAAALAAELASDDEIDELGHLVEAIAAENLDPAGSDLADRAFHLAIARATRNGALFGAVENLWDLRKSSPEAALLHAKARTANIKPVVEEHKAIVDAIRARTPDAARAAMRGHLMAVLDALLFETEADGDDERRARYSLLA